MLIVHTDCVIYRLELKLHNVTIMDVFRCTFEYLPAHRIAICRTHQQGIVKSQLQTHLDSKHRNLVPGTRRRIVQAVSEDESLQNWADNADDVVFPRQDAAPLPYLPVYASGFKCTVCGRIYTHIKGVQQHCRDQHGWKGSHQRTRGRPPAQQDMWTTVSCQKFHNTGTLGRLFQVSGDAPAEVAGEDGDVGVQMALRLTQINRAFEEEKRQAYATIQADDNRYDFKRWLNRIGWARHLKPLKREWLLHMAKKPAYNERALSDVR